MRVPWYTKAVLAPVTGLPGRRGMTWGQICARLAALTAPAHARPTVRGKVWAALAVANWGDRREI
jgi:hypothetical protein